MTKEEANELKDTPLFLEKERAIEDACKNLKEAWADLKNTFPEPSDESWQWGFKTGFPGVVADEWDFYWD